MKASIHFTLDDMKGQTGVNQIKKVLNTLPGINAVDVSESRKQVAVNFDTDGMNVDLIGQHLTMLGHEIVGKKFEEHRK